MSKSVFLAAIFAVTAMSGCADNPNIPTYSGEVRAAVAEKATEVDAYVHSKLSSPMPAWDATQQAGAKPSASPATANQGSVAQHASATSEPASTGAVTTESVETYSVSPSK